MSIWAILLIISLLILSSLGPVNWRLEGTWYDGLQLWEYELRVVVMPVTGEVPPLHGGVAVPEWGDR